MRTKIAIIALIVGAFAVIGCAGSPVNVDRFGNIQPNSQVFQPSRENGTLTGFEVRPFDRQPNEDGLRVSQMPMTFGLPYSLDSSTTLFNFNGYWTKQMPMSFTLPYNQDRSLTLFNFNGFRVKLAPMVDGRFWGL